MYEPEPNDQEKALLDKFVIEYLKDFDPYQACLRIGFMPAFAAEYCKLYMAKPYVQRQIADHKSKPANTTEDVIERDKQLILNTLRLTLQHGPLQSRTAAAKILAGIHGIDQAPDRTGDELAKLVDTFRDIAKHLPE
jgi:hypothetical protein